MIFDHLMYDFWGFLPSLCYDYPYKNIISESLYNFSLYYWNAWWRIAIRYVVIFVFLALTGICCSFSKNNLKRGFKLMLVSIGLTIVTYFMGVLMNDPEMMITFGILHCIAFSLIIIGIFEKFIKNKWFYLIIGLAMTGVGIYFEMNYKLVNYGEDNLFMLILKQMVGINCCGSDCAPWLFNGGQIFIGVFLGKLLYKDKKSLFNLKYSNNFITFTGKHSLIVYLAHQIVLPVLLGLIFLMCGFTLIR